MSKTVNSNRAAKIAVDIKFVFCYNRQAEAQIRLRGQEVKTSPFHGGNTGSIPVGVTNSKFHYMKLLRKLSMRASQIY